MSKLLPSVSYAAAVEFSAPGVLRPAGGGRMSIRELEYAAVSHPTILGYCGCVAEGFPVDVVSELFGLGVVLWPRDVRSASISEGVVSRLCLSCRYL
jgi:hypothetical protein